MHEFRVSPTPRNYEIWYAFCRGDNLLLNERMDALLLSKQPLSAGLLDDLYREMFATSSDYDALRDGSTELHQVATELVDRVLADRGVIDTLGDDLERLSKLLPPLPSASDLRIAKKHTLMGTSAHASERLGALECLLTASIQRISDLKEKLTKAEQNATHDALTGLKNRRYFDSALHRAAQLANDEKSALTLLLFDIDHFKRVNDTFDHTVGDNVLRLVAKALVGHFKGRDVVARYGGEEFAIILPETVLQDGFKVAEQLRCLLENRRLAIRNMGQDLGGLTCSIGCAEYRHGELLGVLMDRVDRALYQAKHDGRNRVMIEAICKATPVARQIWATPRSGKPRSGVQ